MLRSRLIPVLLLSDGALIQTVRFKKDTYLGDPLNAVKIFNDKGVDELLLFDLDASSTNFINYKLIERIAAECQMPFCYGGGISTSSEVEQLISLGVEKVSINSTALFSKNVIQDSVSLVGSQSVAVCIDLIYHGIFRKKLKIFNHTSNSIVSFSLQDYIVELLSCGIGEVIFQFVDRDGCCSGYDIESVLSIAKDLTTPFTVVGGASSYEDISLLSKQFNFVGCGASSIFTLKGALRAPLIQYPSCLDKLSLLSNPNI